MPGVDADGGGLTLGREHAALLKFLEFIDLFGRLSRSRTGRLSGGSFALNCRSAALTPGLFLPPFVSAVVCQGAHVPGRED